MVFIHNLTQAYSYFLYKFNSVDQKYCNFCFNKFRTSYQLPENIIFWYSEFFVNVINSFLKTIKNFMDSTRFFKRLFTYTKIRN